MLCVNAVILIAFCYINLSYLYTDELVDMADRVARQFEDTMEQPMMETYFNDSRTGWYLQQLDDLNKYARPEKVRIFVVFPNGITSQYNEEAERVTFEVLPPEFFGVFRKAILQNRMVTEGPGIANHFKRWTVAVPIQGTHGMSGGMVITTIFMRDVLQRLIPVFLAVGVSIILTFVLLFRAQRGFSEILESPLNNITRALETWSLSHFTSGAAAKRSDEIGRLARTLDEVADRLEEEQKRRDQDDENRRNFFNNVSHELRTPVAALRAQVELLKDGLAEPEELPEYYDSILKETLYVQEMVDDLLTLSRLQTPNYSMEKVPCCLADILKDIYKSLYPAAALKNIGLHLRQDLPPELTVVSGNYTRLRQLVIIFVENSIKYSNENTNVYISLFGIGTDLLLMVQDEGRGIPQKEIGHVFQHQFRASNTGDRGGTGLGLAIANEIASLLGYTLTLDSEENRGTVVKVHIPSGERLL